MVRLIFLSLSGVCLISAGVLGFIAWDAYRENAQKAEAANRMIRASPFGGLIVPMAGNEPVQPATPTTTKVCGAIATGAVLAFGFFLMLALLIKAPRAPGADQSFSRAVR